jgi:hypothetical protein
MVAGAVLRQDRGWSAEDCRLLGRVSTVRFGQVGPFGRPWSGTQDGDRKSELLEALRGSVGRDEELAVRALEAPMACGLPGDQLGRERLLAMRADDLLRGLMCGKIGHAPTVPPRTVYGRKNR